MNKRVNIYLMYSIVFLQGLVFYGPVATLYRQNRELSLSNMFLIEAISWILMIVFEVPWGWVADRIGYKKTLIISNFIFFVSKIVFYKAHSFGMFFAERVLLVAALAGISGCDVALIYSSIKEEDSEKIFGTYNAFGTAGYLIASVVFSVIIKESMDSTAFYTIIPYGVATVLTLFIKEVRTCEKKSTEFKKSLLMVLNNKNILLIVISYALINEVVQVVGVFLNQAQYIRSGINIKYFGILAVIMQIARLGSMSAYKVSNKLGKGKSIQVLYIRITISCMVLVFTANKVITILCIAFICGCNAIISPIVLDIENKSISTVNRATLLSLLAMFGDLTSATVNVVIGKTADVSIVLAFISCICVCICAYALLIVYTKKSNNKH